MNYEVTNYFYKCLPGYRLVIINGIYSAVRIEWNGCHIVTEKGEAFIPSDQLPLTESDYYYHGRKGWKRKMNPSQANMLELKAYMDIVTRLYNEGKSKAA